MVRRKIGFAILSGVAVAASWVLFLRPFAPRPNCLVTVSKPVITNDASGIRQATFRVANAGRYTVGVLPLFGLENRSGQWKTNLLPQKAIALRTDLMGVLPFHPQSKTLGAGDSFDVTLPLPFDDQGWRASFWFYEIRSPLPDALHKLSTRIGLTKKENGQLIASTDWADQ
jgi:hypothetical protein